MGSTRPVAKALTAKGSFAREGEESKSIDVSLDII
jgi:hypothetical protein